VLKLALKLVMALVPDLVMELALRLAQSWWVHPWAHSWETPWAHTSAKWSVDPLSNSKDPQSVRESVTLWAQSSVVPWSVSLWWDYPSSWSVSSMVQSSALLVHTTSSRVHWAPPRVYESLMLRGHDSVSSTV